MANEAQNRLTLKVGITLDQSTATREWVRLQKEVNAMQAKLMDAQTKANKKANDSVQTTNKSLKQQKSIAQELSGTWNKTLAGFIKFTVISSAFMAVTVSLKNMVNVMYELDTAWTNFKIVTQATDAEVAQVNETVNNLTTSLGRMKKEVIDSVTEFARAGYSIADSLSLAEDAIKGANVGATDLDKITTYLIAGLKSFKLEAEDATRIMDTLFTVANITAIDVEGIGEAFLRSANTLQTAGASVEETTALLAAANESVQDPAKVGTALKTIASRLRGVTEEGEIIPTLADDFKRVGVEIQNADGSFRNIYEVFEDFARVYKNLDDLTQESLLEKLAGKRQKNIMIGLLENFDLAQTSLEAAINSTGSVALANEKYLDSLEGKTQVLKESFNQFLTSISNSDAFKTLLDFFAGLLKVITEVIDKMPILIALVGGLTLAFVSLNPIVLAITGVITAFTAVKTVVDLFGDSVEKQTEKLAVFLDEIARLETEISDLKAIENRNSQQERYLGLLEQELAVKKKLKAGAEKDLATEQVKELNTESLKLLDIIAEVNSKDAMFTDGLDAEGIQYFKTELEDAELQTLAQIEAIKEMQATTDKGSDAYNVYATALAQADLVLLELKATYDSLGIVVPKATSNTNEFKSAVTATLSPMQELANALFAAKQYTSGATEDYQTLSDALYELETQGYLTEATFQAITEAYPQLISETGLATDAVRQFAVATSESLKTEAQAHIDNLEIQKKVFLERIKLYESYMKLLASGGGNNAELMEGAKTFLGGNFVAQANAAITNADNAIASIEQEVKRLGGIDKSREDSIDSVNKKTEKEIDLLTESERALNAVNQQIAMQQKLYARTEDADEQIKINLALIELYKKQKLAIEKVRDEYKLAGASLKKTDEGYDDYIKTLYDFALQIEDATNNMYNLTQTNEDLAKSIKETNDEIAKNKLDDLTEDIDKAIDKEIEKLKDLQKVKDEGFEKSIRDIETQIDGLNATNEALEDQIKLQELLDNLQELRQRKANIEGNKNVQLVSDSGIGFEWVADPRELRQVNEEIKDAQTDLDNFNRDLAQKAEIDRLERIKFNIEEEQRIMNESYDQEIEDWERFKSSMDELLEAGGMLTQDILGMIMGNLGTIEKESYAARLVELAAYVSSYNSTMAGLVGGSGLTQVQKPITKLGTGMNFDSMYNSSTGGTSTTAPTATKMSANVTPVAGATNNKNTNINTINVSGNRESVDAIIRDANAQAKVMKY